MLVSVTVASYQVLFNLPFDIPFPPTRECTTTLLPTSSLKRNPFYHLQNSSTFGELHQELWRWNLSDRC